MLTDGAGDGQSDRSRTPAARRQQSRPFRLDRDQGHSRCDAAATRPWVTSHAPSQPIRSTIRLLMTSYSCDLSRDPGAIEECREHPMQNTNLAKVWCDTGARRHKFVTEATAGPDHTRKLGATQILSKSKKSTEHFTARPPATTVAPPFHCSL